MNGPAFDLEEAHRYFSADCFNKTWDLLDKPVRSPDEEQEMIRMAMAAYFHWTQRKDHTPTHLSVSLWQISRVYSVLNQNWNARHYGQLCLDLSIAHRLPAFYLGYAYEALARVEVNQKDRDKASEYLKLAYELLPHIDELEDRVLLQKDLDALRQCLEPH
jgi:tetratricopeptide (TPR) repeat protein